MDKEKLRKLWSEYSAALALSDAADEKLDLDPEKAADAEFVAEWDRLYEDAMSKAVAFRDALSGLAGIEAKTAWRMIDEYPDRIEEILR